MIDAILVGLHLLFAAVFVGANVFLYFLLAPRLELIPPPQVARLGERLTVDFAWVAWGTLIGLPITGIAQLVRLGMIGELFESSFYVTSYGAALAVMMLLWFSMVVTGWVMTFPLRSRLAIGLPYDPGRQEIEAGRNTAPAAVAWIRRLARYNAVAGVIAAVVGGFLRFGGFWQLREVF
jgi:uncharacterized membrane protein